VLLSGLLTAAPAQRLRQRSERKCDPDGLAGLESVVLGLKVAEQDGTVLRLSLRSDEPPLEIEHGTTMISQFRCVGHPCDHVVLELIDAERPRNDAISP
jgi:hypothetical protein